MRLDDHGTARLSLASVAAHDAGNASMLSTGQVPLRVALDDDRSPVFRELPVAVLPREYRAEPVGEPARWRGELLAHAAGSRPPNSPAPNSTPTAVIQAANLDRALWMIDHRADCADLEAVGLMNLWHRVPADR